jgi:hypothetical protein
MLHLVTPCCAMARLLEGSRLRAPWALQATPLQAADAPRRRHVALWPNAGRKSLYWASVGIELSCAPGLLNFLELNQALVVCRALRECDI